MRIIAATNRRLKQLVAESKFREDLFYRVNVLAIDLPPLRERSEDIGLLIDHFLPKEFEIDPHARAAMLAYHWPGNVRELINVIQRATILADNSEITLDDLPCELVDATNGNHAYNPLQGGSSPSATGEESSDPASVDRLEQMTRVHVMSVLEREKGNKARAARALGIHRRKLYRLLDRFGGDAGPETDEDDAEKPDEQAP